MEYPNQLIAAVLKEFGMDEELISYMTQRGPRR